MKWKRGLRSADLEDRRGTSAGVGGGRGRAGPRLKLGLGGTLVVIALSLAFGRNFFAEMGGATTTVEPPRQTRTQTGRSGSATPARRGSAQEEKLVDFVSFVLDDTQNVWNSIFAKDGKRYPRAKLVLFTGSVSSACGFASAASGPFYCPGDNKVYIDLAFYRELHSKFGAPGDFAQAYVLAHEIGHHVQTVLGVNDMVRRKQRSNPRMKNQLQVMMELQADCLAGVWANSTKKRDLLDPSDVEEGMRAAASVGDDNIQKKSRGYVTPESFTHGSSRQRVEWFLKGFKTGDADQCNTFSGRI